MSIEYSPGGSQKDTTVSANQISTEIKLTSDVRRRKPKLGGVIGIGLTVALALACSESADIIPTATALPTITPFPTTDPLQVEMNSNTGLQTTEERNLAILATAQAAESTGWNELVAQGFSKRAVETSIQLNHYDDTEGWSGSGNALRYKDETTGYDYWVIISAGHVVSKLKERSLIEKQTFWFSRNDSFPNSGVTVVEDSNIGVSYRFYGTTDLGIIVIPTEVVNNYSLGDIAKLNALQFSDLSFEPPFLNETFSGVCFPGITEFKPTVVMESFINSVEPTPEGEQVAFDDALSEGGCSGGGLFRSNGDKLVAVQASVTDLERSGSNGILIWTDNLNGYPLSSFGEEEFKALINEAIDEYLSKNPVQITP